MSTSQQIIPMNLIMDDSNDFVGVDHEIREIERDMLELNAIFKDMSSLIKDQTQIIDNIEYHVENSVRLTDEGVIELQKVKQNQSETCILI